MGSEWGLRPLTIGSTTAEVSAIHWFAASRLRGHGKLAIGGRLGQSSGDLRRHRRDGPYREPGERTDGPEPGHLMARHARRHGRPDERSDGGADGTGAPG
jgi:hypothetical protein